MNVITLHTDQPVNAAGLIHRRRHRDPPPHHPRTPAVRMNRDLHDRALGWVLAFAFSAGLWALALVAAWRWWWTQ